MEFKVMVVENILIGDNMVLRGLILKSATQIILYLILVV